MNLNKDMILPVTNWATWERYR